MSYKMTPEEIRRLILRTGNVKAGSTPPPLNRKPSPFVSSLRAIEERKKECKKGGN